MSISITLRYCIFIFKTIEQLKRYRVTGSVRSHLRLGTSGTGDSTGESCKRCRSRPAPPSDTTTARHGGGHVRAPERVISEQRP
jgi:hypothetical protein